MWLMVSIIAGSVTVPLMQFPLLVRAGIWNLAMVPAIARLVFTMDTVGSLTSTD